MSPTPSASQPPEQVPTNEVRANTARRDSSHGLLWTWMQCIPGAIRSPPSSTRWGELLRFRQVQSPQWDLAEDDFPTPDVIDTAL